MANEMVMNLLCFSFAEGQQIVSAAGGSIIDAQPSEDART
jgi:hypothetical protein